MEFIHSIVGSLGVPAINGTALNQPGMIPTFPTSVLPTTAIPSFVTEPVGQPSECLLLKNMFDPATEVDSCFFFSTKSQPYLSGWLLALFYKYY